jgi:choline dehydrogenase-like flavoprotein
MLGGRTNHWGRISLRFGPEDFRGKTREAGGYGMGCAAAFDGYDDLVVTYYKGIVLYHNEPDGKFLPPPKPRCYELLVKKASDNLKITCIPSRLSILTTAKPGRQACHYCGQCNRGCSVKANFSSPDVLIAPALETGRLTLLTNSMAREVTVGRDGLATGVSYIDKETGEERHVAARVVVLAASAFESARLLLNSKSSQYPQGLANSSGVVGKYITDTTGTDVSGFIPAMVDHVPHNEDGVGGMHVYMPWWLDNKKLDFPRGYHIEVGGGLHPPAYGFMGGIQRYPGKGGYGAKLKDDYRRYYGATIGFSGRGEQIPNDVLLRSIRTWDKFGIPVLRFHWEWPITSSTVKHAGDLPRPITEMVLPSAMPSKEQGYDAWRRIIHEPWRPHGERSQDVSAQRQPPGASTARICSSRMAPGSHPGRQESDGRSSASVTATTSQRAQEPRRHRSDGNRDAAIPDALFLPARHRSVDGRAQGARRRTSPAR